MNVCRLSPKKHKTHYVLTFFSVFGLLVLLIEIFFPEHFYGFIANLDVKKIILLLVGVPPISGFIIYMILCPFDYLYENHPILRKITVYSLFIVTLILAAWRFQNHIKAQSEQYLPAQADHMLKHVLDYMPEGQPAESKDTFIYKVKSGDTLTGISLKLTGTKENWKKIMKYNHIPNEAALQKDQTIIIPKSLIKNKVRGQFK